MSLYLHLGQRRRLLPGNATEPWTAGRSGFGKIGIYRERLLRAATRERIGDWGEGDTVDDGPRQ